MTDAKLRHFFIDLYSWTAHRTREEIPTQNKIVEVREISPEIDAAVKQCVEALENHQCWTDDTTEIHEALDAYRRATKEGK